MKVEEAVAHGRIGPVKSEYTEDELPLDPGLAGRKWPRIGVRAAPTQEFHRHLRTVTMHQSKRAELVLRGKRLLESVGHR